jgi:predicted small lipoprotein YifL
MLFLTLNACGRKGALEAPPGDMTPRVEAKRNTFFNANAKIEKQKSDVDPNATVLNPQLTAAGQVVKVTEKTGSSSDKSAGVAPVGGGRKGKRILPPKDDFILDPLL